MADFKHKYRYKLGCLRLNLTSRTLTLTFIASKSGKLFRISHYMDTLEALCPVLLIAGSPRDIFCKTADVTHKANKIVIIYHYVVEGTELPIKFELVECDYSDYVDCAQQANQTIVKTHKTANKVRRLKSKVRNRFDQIELNTERELTILQVAWLICTCLCIIAFLK